MINSEILCSLLIKDSNNTEPEANVVVSLYYYHSFILCRLLCIVVSLRLLRLEKQLCHQLFGLRAHHLLSLHLISSSGSLSFLLASLPGSRVSESLFSCPVAVTQESCG